MNVEFRNATEADREMVRQFLIENGWAERVTDEDRFDRMMRNADRAFVAITGGHVIGFARALCDDASNGYIGTVAVAENLRGKGIGSELVKRIIGDDPNITWVLRAGRGSNGFWEKMGFTRSNAAMEKTRSR